MISQLFLLEELKRYLGSSLVFGKECPNRLRTTIIILSDQYSNRKTNMGSTPILPTLGILTANQNYNDEQAHTNKKNPEKS